MQQHTARQEVPGEFVAVDDMPSSGAAPEITAPAEAEQTLWEQAVKLAWLARETAAREEGRAFRKDTFKAVAKDEAIRRIVAGQEKMAYTAAERIVETEPEYVAYLEAMIAQRYRAEQAKAVRDATLAVLKAVEGGASLQEVHRVLDAVGARLIEIIESGADAALVQDGAEKGALNHARV
jgi:hypothetical protein